MIHAISFLSTFTIGGLSGIFMADDAGGHLHPRHRTSSWPHFHYVVAGIIFAHVRRDHATGIRSSSGAR